MLEKSLRIARKIDYVNSMLIAKRINPVFLDLTYIAATRLNHLTKFCKIICFNLIQVKLLNRSAIKLNHFLELL